jgi:hypothetical protein
MAGLEILVNEKMQEEYIPQGGVSVIVVRVGFYRYTQSMMKLPSKTSESLGNFYKAYFDLEK